jgi:hypothetical protein
MSPRGAPSDVAADALSSPSTAIRDRSRLQAKLAALNEKARRLQWDASTDLDWTRPSEFGAPLPDDSEFALDCFRRSPLGRYGRPMWDAFRWEFESWMVSQFLSGEKAALTAASGLAVALPDAGARASLAAQAVDEARHVEVFSRYVREKMSDPYTVPHSFAGLLSETFRQKDADITVLGLQIMIEALALAAFRMAESTFHDTLLKQICRLAAQDEARHVSFGVLYLQSVYPQLTSAELREREEFAVEALHFVYRRFRLEEIWERLEIRKEDGIGFMNTNPLMIQYQNVVCAKIMSSLRNIGLIGPRMREQLRELGLHGPAAPPYTAPRPDPVRSPP